MKYLGIDYGTHKVGIAVSDDDGAFAFPKAIVATTTAVETIGTLCTSEKIDAIVIGESLASNGLPNEVNRAAQRFAEKIKTGTGVPVYFEREAFSSVEAHRYQPRAGNRDDSAAAIILQRYLDKQKK